MDTINKLGIILIADGTAENLRILSQILTVHGYKALAFKTGSEVIASIKAELPDLILLNTKLPVINGYELCTRLKADVQTSAAPILFISESNETNDKLHGFEVGGADFITKPFIDEEVLARIQTHLEISRLRAELKLKATELKTANKQIQVEIAERKNAVAERTEETVRKGIIFEQAPDGIVVVDPHTGRFIEFNTTAHRQLGYTREEFAVLSIADVEAKETYEETKSTISRVMVEGRVDFETLQKTKSGEIRNILVTAQSIDNSGHPVYHCLWRDITDRKLAEMKLKESEGKYRTLFDNIPIGIGVTNLTGKLVTFNDSILEPGGYSRDDLIRMGSVENLYYNLSDRETLVPLLKEKGTITQYPIKFKRKDGSPYDTLLTLSIIYINDRPMIQAVVEDITERKQAEDSLRLFRTLLDKSNDAIEVIDVETGQFVDVNERACTDLGYSRSELLKMSVFDIDPNQNMHDFQLMLPRYWTVKFYDGRIVTPP